MLKAINDDCTVLADQPTDWTKLFQRLRELERILAGRRYGGMGPRAGFAFLTSLGLCLGVMISFFGLDQMGLHVRSDVFTLAPMAAGFVCFFLVRSHSKRPKTWTALLDQELAAYEPIDKDAYRRLQQRTRDLGYLESNEVYEWIGFERHAIEVASGHWQASPSGFLSKKL